MFLLGYDEALGMTLTNETSVSQFIDAADPIRLLTDATAIHFRPEDDVYREHPATGEDVTTSLKDLKVRCGVNLCGTGRPTRTDAWTHGCEVRSKLPRLSPTVVPAPD